MIIWVYRALVLLGCPLLVYTQITHSQQGLLIGLGVGVLLVLLEMALEALNLLTMVFGILGAAGGIFVSKLLDYSLLQMGNDRIFQTWDRYSLLSHFALAMLGAILAIRKFPELDTLDKDILAMGKRRGAEMKVVDTSAIIDGRLVDICETHFLSGQLVVPRFVLNEMQRLADSADATKRARGRRGLDILARLKENQDIPLKIIDRDIPELQEVDAKVVRLAKELGGKVITTDFNLKKVSAVEGIQCLNVNDLANSLKPVVLPGEAMSIFVMKEGKEREQGIGYLDDGTMVVIEDGKRHIGKRVEANVTSILQSSAGRMIFTKAKA